MHNLKDHYLDRQGAKTQETHPHQNEGFPAQKHF
jgi:hypothetical protein